MKIPTNMTEAEVLVVIEKIVNIVCKTFPFGYFELDDIKQEARIKAIKALEKYDEKRPLENFLYTVLKRLLINFKRDNYERTDTPCVSCHNAISGFTQHADGKYCERYIEWKKRITRKKNIINPRDITNIADEKESNTTIDNYVEQNVHQRELLSIIDERLPIELRVTYLQMRDGIKVSKTKRVEVEKAVLEILGADAYV